MGRPPCCDKVGIKKGPWTPEEDIVLVSYIQEHGPGNWRSVPANTGLLRCSKSCRLRWTNYLRPGIKRGNFTPHEEGMIIHLQAMMGNRWAAIASYLPQRTDNDIKNFWNTHLKKKIKKFQTPVGSYMTSSDSIPTCYELMPNGHNMETRAPGVTTIHSPLPRLHQSPSTYASSTENISRLLEGWMRSSPTPRVAQGKQQQSTTNSSIAISTAPNQAKDDQGSFGPISHEELESLLSFENLGGPQPTTADFEDKQRLDSPHSPPMSLLEKWLLDDTSGSGQVEGLMELSSDCCSDAMF